MTSLTPRIDRLESGRNLVINGNFDFWQRGTSFTATFNQTKGVADRIVLDSWGHASANVTCARVAEAPTLEESGFKSAYSLKLTNNNASGSAVTLRYCLEGYDYQQIHASKVRFQFWVRSSLTGTYSVAFNNDRGAGNRYYLTTYNVTAANVWQKVAIDVQLDDTANWNFDNTAGLSIMFGIGIPTTVSVGKSILNSWQTGDGRTYLSNNAWATTLNATWQVAQVQLTKGDFAGTGVDLPFSRCGKNIQDELSMCQRYYEKSYELDTALGTVTAAGRVTAVATAQTSSIISLSSTIPFKVKKRVAPTITTYRSSDGVVGGFGYINPGSTGTGMLAAINLSTPDGFELTDNEPGAAFLTSTTFLLYGHYTAEAEIGV